MPPDVPQRAFERPLDVRTVDARGQAAHNGHSEGATQELHHGAKTRTRTHLVDRRVPTMALEAGAITRPIPNPTSANAMATVRTPMQPTTWPRHEASGHQHHADEHDRPEPEAHREPRRHIAAQEAADGGREESNTDPERIGPCTN